MVSFVREPWLEILLGAALLLALVGGVVSAYVWWRRRHTRERYAFVALSTTVGLALTAVSVLSLPNWLELVTSLLGQLGLPLEAPRELSIGERVSVVLILGYAMRQINRNHREWDGPKSVVHRERERLREEIGLVQEGLGEVKRVLRREPPPVAVDAAVVGQAAYQLQMPTESLSWPEQVYDLLRLSRPSYHFDEKDGWHEIERCWIGHNTKTNETIAVLCTVDAPTVADVASFVAYAQQIATDPVRLVLFVALAGADATLADELAGRGVQLLTEDALLDALVDFSSYRRHIIDRFARDYLLDSAPTLNDVYVSATASAGISIDDEEASGVSVDALLDAWASEQGQRHLALLGDYGQGKSTCALAFAHRLLTGENPSGRIPLLIELRGRSPSALQPLEFLGGWSARFEISPQALLKLIAAGKIILIFEGFDEMAYVSDHDSRVQHLQSLWRFCYPRAKLLFTGSRNFFLDDHETLQSLGIRAAGGGPYCELFHLRPFTTDQIRATLAASGFAATEELLGLAKVSESFREVVTRPATLHMVRVLWSLRADAFLSNATSAQVLQLFIDRTYQRQAEKHRGQRLGESTRFMLLTIAERAYFMTGIAAHMAAQRLKNQITRDDLEALIERLYEKMPDQELAKQAQPALDEPTTPLKTRIRDRPDALDALKTDVRIHGLLVRDPSRQIAYRFPHKSYLELLFANYAFEFLEGTNKWSANSIRAAAGAKLSDLTGMPESVEFLAEILSTSTSESAKGELFNALVLSQVPMLRFLPLGFVRFLCESQKRAERNAEQFGFYKRQIRLIHWMATALVFGSVLFCFLFASVFERMSQPAVVVYSFFALFFLFCLLYALPRLLLFSLVRTEEYDKWQMLQERLR